MSINRIKDITKLVKITHLTNVKAVRLNPESLSF